MDGEKNRRPHGSSEEGAEAGESLPETPQRPCYGYQAEASKTALAQAETSLRNLPPTCCGQAGAASEAESTEAQPGQQTASHSSQDCPAQPRPGGDTWGFESKEKENGKTPQVHSPPEGCCESPSPDRSSSDHSSSPPGRGRGQSSPPPGEPSPPGSRESETPPVLLAPPPEPD